jgi:glucose-6-phosphate 1-dehydrogenase
MSYFGQQYPLYYPQSISGYERVKMITMTQTTMTEMEQRTKQLVIFGATGDLCKKKLIPALYKLWERGLLQENLLVTGTARREPTVTQWKESLGEYPEEFLHHLDYQPSDLTKGETLQCLPQAEDVTYFLSVPPERYEDAIINLKEAGLLDNPETSRVVIEKPFGHDYKSADHLQSVVQRYLREKQVYRIDHYLGKDTVNNILATRFSNILLEPLWNRNYIDEIQIYATETIGCEGRSQYYEGSGVIRDMLQNHLLQIISLVAMEPPSKLDAREIRREKVKVLAAMRLGKHLIPGQYIGYREEDGVDSNSEVATFVAGDIYIDNWRWQGVPFYYMTGKNLPYGCVEVVVKLKSPPQQLFDGHEANDRIVMRFQPNAHLDIRIDIKKPGLDESVELATLSHDYPMENASQGYTKLLYEAMAGNQSHFVHAEEVLESWRIVDDLLCVGDNCKIRTTPYLYTAGTWGPSHKTQFITNWEYPE